jgi:hypothetical protein
MLETFNGEVDQDLESNGMCWYEMFILEMTYSLHTARAPTDEDDSEILGGDGDGGQNSWRSFIAELRQQGIVTWYGMFGNPVDMFSPAPSNR